MSWQQPSDQPFDWRELEPGPEDYEFATILRRDGATLAEVHGHLLQRGLRPEFATRIVTDLTEDFAGKLLSQGMSRSQIHDRLMQQGLTLAEAEAVTDAARENRSGKQGGLALLGVGCMFVFAGAMIGYGNGSELFPTIQYAEHILIPLGVFTAAIGGYRLRV